jgi:hypothetical protein
MQAEQSLAETVGEYGMLLQGARSHYFLLIKQHSRVLELIPLLTFHFSCTHRASITRNELTAGHGLFRKALGIAKLTHR